MGDDSEIQAKGIVRIDIEDGYFNNVLFMPDLLANLLSVYQMTHIGTTKRVTFTQNDVDISEISTGQVVAVGIVDHDSRMYKFSHFLPYSKGNALLSHANETNKLWNERSVHFNYRYRQALSKETMVEGLPSIKFSKGTCKGFIVGKHVEHKYDKGKKRRVVQVLDLMHSDMIGPLLTLSYEKSMYVLTFLDDFSRYCWVYFLKLKSEVFETFKVFKALVENKSGNKIKASTKKWKGVCQQEFAVPL